ncbi:MAG: hypothetical protein ABFR35_09460, partial [Thermodesulfobacteriota bacterium]
RHRTSHASPEVKNPHPTPSFELYRSQDRSRLGRLSCPICSPQSMEYKSESRKGNSNRTSAPSGSSDT